MKIYLYWVLDAKREKERERDRERQRAHGHYFSFECSLLQHLQFIVQVANSPTSKETRETETGTHPVPVLLGGVTQTNCVSVE